MILNSFQRVSDAAFYKINSLNIFIPYLQWQRAFQQLPVYNQHQWRLHNQAGLCPWWKHQAEEDLSFNTDTYSYYREQKVGRLYINHQHPSYFINVCVYGKQTHYCEAITVKATTVVMWPVPLEALTVDCSLSIEQLRLRQPLFHG